MALDLRKCGIGNIVLESAAHLLTCTKNALPPVIVHDNPPELGVLDLGYFNVSSDVRYIHPDLNRVYCSLGVLKHPEVRECMKSIVAPIDVPIDMKDIEAGFCFRVSYESLDGADNFMNETAIRVMLDEMKKYSKVFVCANSESILKRAIESHPNVVYLEPVPENITTRNAPDHIVQWHALSKCPIVYHGIKGGMPDVTTSTFAAVALAYGKECPADRDIAEFIVGITNDGRALCGRMYPWN